MSKKNEIGVWSTASSTTRSTLKLISTAAFGLTNVAEAGAAASYFYKNRVVQEGLEEAGYSVSAKEAEDFLSDLLHEKVYSKDSSEGRMKISERLATFAKSAPTE